MRPERTSSIEEFISYGNTNKLTYTNYAILEKISDTNIRVSIHNIIDEYIEDINSACVDLILPTEEMIKFKFKPWLLAYEIYGTIDLSFLILRLNNMISDKEFTKSKLKVLHPDGLELINRIYNSEKQYIQDNRYNTD